MTKLFRALFLVVGVECLILGNEAHGLSITAIVTGGCLLGLFSGMLE